MDLDLLKIKGSYFDVANCDIKLEIELVMMFISISFIFVQASKPKTIFI
jgi:hypothetical protein